MKRFLALLLLVVMLVVPFGVFAGGGSELDNFPSTNEANRNSNAPLRPGQKAPHVKLAGIGPGYVELEFVMPYGFNAVFEVKIDGDANLTDIPHWGAMHPWLDDDELVHIPCLVVKNGVRVERFEADALVEVRHAAGAESDWFFDWTPFYPLMAGPQGPEGPEGPQGPPGEQGLQGEKGDPGEGLPLIEVPEGVHRISGADRYATAAEIALAAYPNGVDVVIIARGDDFADALAGGALSDRVGAPILLTRSDDLPGATIEAIKMLGPSSIIVLGGEQAISYQVWLELKGLLE